MNEDDFDHPQEPIEGIFTCLGEAVKKPPAWIIKDLLPQGLVFMVAPPKAGKSTMTMAIAALVAGYECKALPPFLSQVDKPGPVVCFSYEADAGELRHMVEEGLKVKVKPNRSIVVADNPWEFRLDDEDGLARLLGWLDEIRPRLVILDPFRDFHSLEEKDSGDMNRVLRPLRKWSMDNEAAVMVVHHTKKREDGGAGGYSTNDIRGSSALFGIADGVIVLSPRGGEATEIATTFKRAKSNSYTITVASYGRAGQQPGERITDRDRMVLKALHSGAQSLKNLAFQMGTSLANVQESVDKLARNGQVTKKGTLWVPVNKRGATE